MIYPLVAYTIYSEIRSWSGPFTTVSADNNSNNDSHEIEFLRELCFQNETEAPKSLSSPQIIRTQNTWVRKGFMLHSVGLQRTI